VSVDLLTITPSLKQQKLSKMTSFYELVNIEIGKIETSYGPNFRLSRNSNSFFSLPHYLFKFIIDIIINKRSLNISFAFNPISKYKTFLFEVS